MRLALLFSLILLAGCAGGGGEGEVAGVRGARSGARTVVDISKLIPARGRGETEGLRNDEALLESLYTLVTTDLLLILGRTEDRGGTLQAYLDDATEMLDTVERREEELQPRLEQFSGAIADLQESAEDLQGKLEDSEEEEDSAGAVKFSSELVAVSEKLALGEAERSSLQEMLEAMGVFRTALELQVSFLEEHREEIIEGTFQGELPGIPYLQEVQAERVGG